MRTAGRAARLGRKLAGIMHGGIAAILIGICVAAVLAAVTAGVAKVAKPIGGAAPTAGGDAPPIGTFSHHPVVVTLPARPASYVGAYVKGLPGSYAPLTALGRAAAAPLNVA
ncbi:MAG: hypothetical protein ACRDOD_18065, partial [Streptosporangiaceae bacterium]